MDVEWGADKARANLRKHGVDFANAATVLEDGMAITVRADDPDEEHFVTLGSCGILEPGDRVDRRVGAKALDARLVRCAGGALSR